jgi:preprotein translocase subunit YajC
MHNLAFILLQGQGGGIGGMLVGLMPFILIFAVFYFLIIVPQRKRQRELQEMVSQLKAGDRILTTGGVIATIATVREKSLLVRSDKSVFEITRAAVASPYTDEEKGS